MESVMDMEVYSHCPECHRSEGIEDHESERYMVICTRCGWEGFDTWLVREDGTNGIPTLYEMRLHIRAHAWNGQDFEPEDSNYTAFRGQCEYASTAMSEILTGTGHNTHPRKIDWSLRVRGWYCGDLSDIAGSHDCDEHALSEGKHCHSWVEYRGKIYDPTWWQFAGGDVKVYMFELGDPRFIRDPNA